MSDHAWVFAVGCLFVLAIVAVAVVFLRHLTAERESREALKAQRQVALKHLGDDCYVHAERMLIAVTKALDKSNETIQENTRVLGRIAMLLDQHGARE